MNMIRPAVGLNEPGILEARDGTHIGMQTMVPLRINKASSPLSTPDHMEIYTEKLACHTLSNWMVGKENIGRGCRAFGAHSRGGRESPGLTAGPIHWRPFGPP